MQPLRLASARTVVLTLVLATGALALGPAARAAAQATLVGGLGGPAGFGPSSLAPNDDGSSTVISLAAAFPTGLNFFGTVQTNIYVNNNGNVTFAGPVGLFTPTAFPVAARPMIAPWWGDVDTRNRTRPAEQNLAYWSVSPGRFVATWHNVGYYNSRIDLYNNFQLILTDASALGSAGDFDVEFRYNRCQWTTGDASGGVGGLGGTPAQAGFDAGNAVDYNELPGSRTAAILLLCTTSNVGQPGVWRFQVRNGGVAVCGNGIPELGEGCDDGNLTNGDGCNQFCEAELPPGGACTVDTDCRSGFCTDGVCCDQRCGGQCERCNRPGALGACGAQTGAPFGARLACAGGATSCGGSCNGTLRNACTYPGASTTCDDGAFCTVSDACNGAGGCAAGPARDCSDPLGCTTDACNETTNACTNVLASGCLIASMCVPAGMLDPTNQCMACQPATSTTAFTPLAAGATCDDGAFCTVSDSCNGAGACGGAARDCADTLSCTTDACDESTNSCTSTIAGSCVIGGACVAAGTLDPSNECMACQPALSTGAYTALAAGATCDDGAFCTVSDACNGAGACGGAARDCADALSCTTDACDESANACTSTIAGSCVIGGACVAAGTLDPSNECMACQPAMSTTAYTPLAAGATCDDGAFCTVSDACDGTGTCGSAARDCDDAIDCTADACDEASSMCTHTTGASCVIGGACIAEGTRDPANDCMACQPAIDAGAYTALVTGTGCDDGMFCTDVDSCDGAGACAGAVRDCGDGLDCTTDACDEATDACTTAIASGCRIDGACVPEGATDPADPCRRCEAAMSTDAYVAWPDGPGCTDAGMPDAGVDAGPDAAVEDASVGIDAMPGWEVRGSGACSASGNRRGGPLALAGVLAIGLAMLARRRRSAVRTGDRSSGRDRSSVKGGR